MHHDGVDAHLLQQRDVAAEPFRQMLLAHGMAAVFDHDRRPGIPPQIGQGMRQDPRLLGGVGLDVIFDGILHRRT